MPSSASLYFIKPVEAPWGDIGSILYHGMSQRIERSRGKIRLERTGPFIFPITFPGSIVVTDAMKLTLENSLLTGFTFIPVIKHHIVELDWENWDTTQDEPPFYPDQGEPENYILGRPRSIRAAEAMGNLWEMVLQEGVEIQRIKLSPGMSKFNFLFETWNGKDFFLIQGTNMPGCSEKAKIWLEKYYSDYVNLSPVFQISMGSPFN